MAQVKEKVEKFTIAADAPGHTEVMLGNEAIARGIIEAGAQVATAYPGTPSSEIIDTLSRFAKQTGMYTEWSINEKVASEVAASAAMSGLRAVVAMKAQGLSVATDFLAHLSLLGKFDGGLLVIVCDDPDALSSGSEQDSRWHAQVFDNPLLEPAFPQEGKDMAKWAFELAEKYCPVFMRSVTRISHASSSVKVGEIQRLNRKARVDISRDYAPDPVIQKHALSKQRLAEIEKVFNDSPFNWYEGPKSPKLIVVCSGTGYLYTLDAIDALGATDSVGVLKLGTTWPLPMGMIEKYLKPGTDVLVAEEVDPFIETNLKERLYGKFLKGNPPNIMGKNTGHMPVAGELNPDRVINGIAKVLGIKYQSRDVAYDRKAKKSKAELTIDRPLAYCPGCPHRASFWAVKNVLRLDNTDGFVNGDIGCYLMDRAYGGQKVTKTTICMGAGSGMSSGLGKFQKFGFNQTVLATVGDSTFFHAAIPALINAIHHKANALYVVLDNRATAMTGFQPHPGSGADAMGEPAVAIDIEKFCRFLGCQVEVADPFDLEDAQAKLQKLMGLEGTKVMIMQRTCGLIAFREKGKEYRVSVDTAKCLGEDCGCDRYCNRIFKCPALIWDDVEKHARIDEAMCNGCGFCVSICPRKAIVKEKIQ